MLLKLQIHRDPSPLHATEIVVSVLSYKSTSAVRTWILDSTGLTGLIKSLDYLHVYNDRYLRIESGEGSYFRTDSLVEGKDFTVTEVDRFPPLGAI